VVSPSCRADGHIQTRSTAIVIGNTVPFAFATVFFFGRVYARLGLLQQFGSDDYLISGSWLAALVNCALAVISTRYGEGRHTVDVKPEWVSKNLKILYASRICYQMALGLVKLSIAVFYLRVFNVTRATRIHLYIMIGFILAFTVSLSLENILPCVPPSKTWNLDPSAPGHCSNTIIGFWTSVACQIISDIWIIVFAVPRVWQLKMQRAQRLALLGTLTLGWVTVIAAVIRAVRISTILHSTDSTWVSYDSSIWSAVEVSVSIICAAAPTLKPIFKRWAPGMLYSLSGKTSQGKPGNTDRSAWVKASSKGAGTFEMTRSRIGRHDTASHSQEELAHNGSHSNWGSGKLDMTVSEDDVESMEGRQAHGDGIMKSTHVKVSHWPLTPGSAT